MKKYSITFILAILFYSSSVAQVAPTETTLFAQGIFSVEDIDTMHELEQDLREHPGVGLVRLDWNTQRFLILSNEFESLTEEELRSWFGEYGDSLSCIQIGIKGIDVMQQYPFPNCQN